jgi:hypothetical protein
MIASLGKFIFESIDFEAFVWVKGASKLSMKMDHIKVPVKTYKGYGISVDFTDTIPDMFKKIQVNVVANGMINAQRIPSLLWRYCALISRTDNLQANS